MKYQIGETIYFKSLGTGKTYFGKILKVNEQSQSYDIRSGPYTKIVFENEIIKRKE